MLVLERYVLVNCVVPLPWPFLSFGLTEMLTPLAGFAEATVTVYVAACANAAGTSKPHAQARIQSNTGILFMSFFPFQCNLRMVDLNFFGTPAEGRFLPLPPPFLT